MTCNHEFEILDPSSIDCSGLAPEQVQAAYEGINNLGNLILIDSENFPSILSLPDGIPLYLSTAGTLVQAGSPIACRFIGTKVGDYLNPAGKVIELIQGANIGACKYLRDSGAGVLVETTATDSTAIAISLTPTGGVAECRKVLLVGVGRCDCAGGNRTNVFSNDYLSGFTIEETDNNVLIPLPLTIKSQDGSGGWTVGANGGFVTPKNGSWLITCRFSIGLPISNGEDMGIDSVFQINTSLFMMEREYLMPQRVFSPLYPAGGLPVSPSGLAGQRKTVVASVDNIPAGTEIFCNTLFRVRNWGTGNGFVDLHRFNIVEIFDGF